MTVPAISDHVQAVVNLLNANGVATGRGKRPEAGGWTGAPGQSPFTAYAIVWRVGGRDVVHRDLDGNFDEARPQFHIRTVGGTPDQAADLLDVCNQIVASTPLDVPGREVVHLVFDTSIADARDDDVTPAVYYTGAYWRVWTQDQP